MAPVDVNITGIGQLNFPSGVSSASVVAPGIVEIDLSSGGSGPVLETNGVANSTQALLDLVAGTNVTLSESSGHVTITSSPGSGTVTTTGSPSNGNITKFSGPTTITNSDLSGDVTTSGTLATTVVKINNASIPSSTFALASNGSSQLIAATRSGNTSTLGTTSGSLVSGNLASFDASGNIVDSGTPKVNVGTTITFIINDGTSGTNIGPYLIAARNGSVTKCKIVTKQSDGSTALTIKIKQNGVDVFSADPTVTAGSAGGTITTSTSLTSSPLTVTADDLFTIDITSGTSNWLFTAQLE